MTLPPHIKQPLDRDENKGDLLEVVLDLGREPEARFAGREVLLSDEEVTPEDLEYVVSRIGEFGDDNRAGIPRTLHRISAIRNRKGQVVGLTCRVGRSVLGTMDIIRDLVENSKSTLILGRPGVGKTTLLREIARVLADELKKRVVIVDTSNEIAGDGDIPHPGIGRARRMQVPTPTQQHAVMIEAVENHMPEVIVIDEIGTALEAEAARTIAERGVQLVGTAHGNMLENLLMNPTLSDLVGGIQPVTLGDEEARRRGTQKTVLERKGPPTFDVLVEMQDRQHVVVHRDVSETVDALLRGFPAAVELRSRRPDGTIERRLEVPGAPGVSGVPGRTGGEDRGRRGRGRDFGRGSDGRGWDGRGSDVAGFGTDRGGRRSDYSDRAEREVRTDRGDDVSHSNRGTWADRVSLADRPPHERSQATEHRRGGQGSRPAASVAVAAPSTEEELDEDVYGGPLEAEPGSRFTRRGGSLRPVKIYPYGVNRDRLEAAITGLRVPASITKEVHDADVVMTLKNYYRKSPGPVRDAEDAGKPVFI
ncbi:MAG TPA: AAA family ATPase, partial [Chloroflexota bacterium]|nr:AAA family ATPase [Chloroflexota bacterium]